MSVETKDKNIFNCPVCGFPICNQSDFNVFKKDKLLHLACPSCKSSLIMKRKQNVTNFFFPFVMTFLSRLENKFAAIVGQEWGHALFWIILLGAALIWIYTMLKPTYIVEAEMKEIVVGAENK